MRRSRTLARQDKEKEEIMCHSRTLDHRDREKEETLCLVKVDGISNHHIWRNLNKARRGIIMLKNRRSPNKDFRLLALAILLEREDIDSSLGPHGRPLLKLPNCILS